METTTGKVENPESNSLLEMYLKTKRLLQDFDFMEDELRFFKKVIRQYLLKLGDSLNTKVEKVNSQIYELEMDKHLLRNEVLTELELLDLTIKGLTDQKLRTLEEAAGQLELKVADLFQKLKQFKKELFEVTEEVVRSEEQRQNDRVA